MSAFARILPCFALAALGLGCAATSENPVATPQRPLFSVNTQTTEAGSLEVEMGFEYDRFDRAEIPIRVKYGLSEDVEAFVARSPYRRVRVPGKDAAGGRGVTRVGSSDTLVGARWRFYENDEDQTSAAVRLSASIPTGNSTNRGYANNDEEVFSSREYGWYLAAIYAGVFSDWAWTTFYEVGAVGEPSSGGFDTTHGAAFAVSHLLGGASSDTRLFAELAGKHDRVRSNYPIFATVGLAFAAQPTQVWDAALQIPLNDDAGDVVVKAGMTYNLSASRSSN